ncbi:MAG: hypothetical protein KDK55_04905 [Chlamydiia bacterium]|nr:hypothetical protein [Chlamydiia bacterium]
MFPFSLLFRYAGREFWVGSPSFAGMFQFQKSLLRLLSRFRYPASLPEEVASDLGLFIPNTISFKDFMSFLRSNHCCPTTLKRGMDRFDAERVFSSPLKKEIFSSRTLLSYYFAKGWLVITLFFDEGGQLTRAQVQCPMPTEIEGFDLHLLEKECTLQL